MDKKLTKAGEISLSAPIRWSIIMAIIFFVAAGRVDILRAWIAYGVLLAGGIAGAFILAKHAPELVNRRASMGQGTKPWDKYILVVYFLLVLIAIPVVAGIDVGGHENSPLGTGFLAVGILLYLVYFVLLHWSMVTNQHFESTSRIQTDRNHKVVSSGPYRFVRHPGYIAMILAAIDTPLIIGSAYALIPAIIASIAVVIRTSFEDKMLREELNGYAAYAQKTKNRLIPGIW